MTTPLYAVALSAYLGTGIYLYVQRLRTVGADLAADLPQGLALALGR